MANAMTKSQLYKELAENVELPRKTVVAFMDELTNIAMKETKNSGVFTLPGFGKLRKVNRKARMGRNPQTGEAIKIPAKTVVRFRISKACKEAVVGKK
ncbi:MAG: HU family DNA-binding protein [Candidatus Acidiferrales bacterium]|nr:HU family DNA-binding protein [Acidobacteriota bacterium]